MVKIRISLYSSVAFLMSLPYSCNPGEFNDFEVIFQTVLQHKKKGKGRFLRNTLY